MPFFIYSQNCDCSYYIWNIDGPICVISGGCSDPSASNYSGDCGMVVFMDEFCEYGTNECEQQLGDINGDGGLTIFDVIQMVNIIQNNEALAWEMLSQVMSGHPIL